MGASWRWLVLVLLLALAAAALPAATHVAARLLVLAAEGELDAVGVRGGATGVAGERGVEISHTPTYHRPRGPANLWQRSSSPLIRRSARDDAGALTDSHLAARTYDARCGLRIDPWPSAVFFSKTAEAEHVIVASRLYSCAAAYWPRQITAVAAPTFIQHGTEPNARDLRAHVVAGPHVGSQA